MNLINLNNYVLLACGSVGYCFNRDTEQCKDGHQEDKVNGQFGCPSQPNNVVCCVRNVGVKNEQRNFHNCM